MIWLIYISGLRGPSPRVIYDVDKAGNPILGKAERGPSGILARHRLTADESRLVKLRQLSLEELVRRYPPPRGRDGAPDPSPESPAPIAPKPTGAEAALEVA